MDAMQSAMLVNQAFQQAESGTLPADVFAMLLEKLVAAGNYSVAGMLFTAWREHLGPGFPVSPDERQDIARIQALLVTQIPDLQGLPD